VRGEPIFVLRGMLIVRNIRWFGGGEDRSA
jgi:hypothetical protein